MIILNKLPNLGHYLTAIKAANAIRTATYVSVAALALFNVFKVYKAMVK